MMRGSKSFYAISRNPHHLCSTKQTLDLRIDLIVGEVTRFDRPGWTSSYAGATPFAKRLIHLCNTGVIVTNEANSTVRTQGYAHFAA